MGMESGGAVRLVALGVCRPTVAWRGGRQRHCGFARGPVATFGIWHVASFARLGVLARDMGKRYGPISG